MKRLFFIISGIVVLAMIIAVAAVMRLDAQGIRDHVAAAVNSATGKPLIIQDMPQVSFMPLGIKFGAASWGVTPDGALDPADGISVAVQSGQVSVRLLPLLSGKIMVDEVRLDGPDIQIRPAAKAPPPKAEDAGTAPGLPIPPQVEVSRIRLTNASFYIEVSPGQNVRLSNLTMELDDLKVGANMRLDLSTNIAVSSPALEGALALKANARLQTQKYELHDIALRFTPAKGVVPVAAGPIDLALRATYELDSNKLRLALLSLAVQGSKVELAGDADVNTLAFNGTLKVDSAPRKLAQALGISLPFKSGLENFRLQSPLAMTGRTLNLDAIQGMLDTTGIDGKLSLDLNKMHVAGNLSLGALDLDALMASAPLLPTPLAETLAALISPTEALAATSRKAPQQATSEAPPVAQKVQNAAVSGLPSVDMELACASLTASKLQFKDIRAKVRGQGLYRIEPLTLNLGTGGTVELDLSVDASAMRYTAAGKVSNVVIGPLLQAVQGKRPVEGTANLDLDALACAGTTPKAIHASLSGKGLLTVRGIVLNDVSILPKDAPAGIGKPPTHFEQLTVPFTATGGVVNLAPVTLTSPTANVKGQGIVRLPQESMEFTADVSLLKIATIPVRVSGPFSALSYGLDGKRALQMLTQTPGALGDAAKNLGGETGKRGGETVRGAQDTLKGIFRP